MIRLDHHGHEISRDPDVDPWTAERAVEEVVFHARRGGMRYGEKPAGGYWERLDEDIRRGQEHVHNDPVYCTCHGQGGCPQGEGYR